MQQFRGELVIQDHRLLYHSTLGLRAIEKKEGKGTLQRVRSRSVRNRHPPASAWLGIGCLKPESRHLKPEVRNNKPGGEPETRNDKPVLFDVSGFGFRMSGSGFVFHVYGVGNSNDAFLEGS